MATALELAGMTPQGVYQAIETEAASVNITMYGLCQRAEVDHSTVQKWRSGDNEPTFRTVRKLLKEIEIIKGEIEAKTA